MELDNGEVVDPHGGETVVGGVAPGGAEEKPDFRVTDDRNQVEYGGHKYVREEALHAERERSQGYRETVENMRPLLPEFEQFLRSKQGSERAAVDRSTRGVQSDDYTEDELTGFAITRGYFDGQNQPDLKRAKDDLDIMTAVADRRAGRAVRPLAEETARDRAQRLTERAYNNTFVDGEPIADQRYLKAAFDAVPDNMKADPQAANILQVVAAGLQYLDQRRNPGATRQTRQRTTTREPIFREGSGRNFNDDGTSELDGLDLAAARARGKTPEQWAKMKSSMDRAGRSDGRGGVILEDV